MGCLYTAFLSVELTESGNGTSFSSHRAFPSKPDRRKTGARYVQPRVVFIFVFFSDLIAEGSSKIMGRTMIVFRILDGTRGDWFVFGLLSFSAGRLLVNVFHGVLWRRSMLVSMQSKWWAELIGDAGDIILGNVATCCACVCVFWLPPRCCLYFLGFGKVRWWWQWFGVKNTSCNLRRIGDACDEYFCLHRDDVLYVFSGNGCQRS